MRRWAMLGVVGMLAACGGDPTPGPDTRRTCAQLSWRCGVDDFGVACGSCTSGTACNGAGTCVSTSSGCTCGTAECGVDSCGSPVCGVCPGSGTCVSGVCIGAQGPRAHSLGAAQLPLFDRFAAVPFTVPGASVSYNTTSPTDTYDVAIFTTAEWSNFTAGAQARAYAQRQNVRTAAETASVPAGSYVLGFYCRNLIERCDVTYALGATY